MTYHRARVCTSLTASSPLLASIVRLTNALQDKRTRSRVHVDKQTSRVQTASASLRVHISDSDLLSGRYAEPDEVECTFFACLNVLIWQPLKVRTCIDKKMGAVASTRDQEALKNMFSKLRHLKPRPTSSAPSAPAPRLSWSISWGFSLESLHMDELCRTRIIENGGKTIRPMEAVHCSTRIN